MRRGGLGPIVLSSDAAYAMPLAVTLRSIVESNIADWPLSFHILYSGIDDELRSRIESSLPRGSARVSWHHVDVSFWSNHSFTEAPHMSPMSFARIQIADALRNHHGRALFLDSDLLVFGSLRDLWNVDLGRNHIAAVEDSGIATWKARGDPMPENFPSVSGYFNAGVMLIDLDAWREARVAERAMQYLAKQSTPFGDQDALNAVIDGRWKSLDRRWNLQIYPMAEPVTKTQAAIVHFVTGTKPWKFRELNHNSALYDEYRSRTEFARTLDEKGGDFLKASWARLKRLARTAMGVCLPSS